jgi:hypothetical protein
MTNYKIVNEGTVLGTFQTTEITTVCIASCVMSVLSLPVGTSLRVKSGIDGTFYAQYDYTVLLVEPVGS